MGNTYDPNEAFNEALRRRATIPLIQDNPYKLREAFWGCRQIHCNASAALDYERRSKKTRRWAGALCVAYERNTWTRRMLGQTVAIHLGYDAIPGLAAMDRPDLLADVTRAVTEQILPQLTGGLALPNGEPMMGRLVDVTSAARDILGSALDELGFREVEACDACK